MNPQKGGVVLMKCMRILVLGLNYLTRAKKLSHPFVTKFRNFYEIYVFDLGYRGVPHW
jgi:hypothetical protein